MIVGILGGSGLYDFEGLRDVREQAVATPWGQPSAALLRGRVGDVEVAFLPRHGRGHRLLPSEINFRANIHALKHVGVEHVVSVSAVGSMREGIRPGDMVVPDQFIDRTYRRDSTFFGDGVVGHVSLAEPVCSTMAAALKRAALAAGCHDGTRAARGTAGPRRRPPRVYPGGTYVCIEGPQFSSRAESLLYRSWGVDVIGMTAATEAKLAREAELCFASLALSTDYDCWHPAEDAVTAASVVEVMKANVARAKDIVRKLLDLLPGRRACACGSAAAHAIMTAPGARDGSTVDKLKALYGREIA